MYIFQSPKQPTKQPTNHPASQPTPNFIQWYPEFPNQQLCTVILNNRHKRFAATNVLVHPTKTAATRRKNMVTVVIEQIHWISSGYSI